ncbi:MAG: hypothetical protein LBU03_05215 [Tannerellaceae bacterium]|jgi:hypothetical protein|nr:hypothetical protein [Tannerellaceae bacterium]
MKLTKRIYKGCCIFLIFVVAIEIYLRYYWGFCDTVLTEENERYEYIAQPNQERFRFRKHIRYNEFSMRSRPVEKTDGHRVLVFGDSVINGGVLTDQDSLATMIIENTLNKYNSWGGVIRILNISYGSWGPDNCFAFMQEYGDFDAGLIILIISSHDAYDTMTFEKVIDILPSYPSKQYSFACYELWDRYLLPRFFHKRQESKEPIIKGNVFNPGFKSFHDYVKEKNIPFFIYLHPTLSELIAGKYEIQGEEIVRFCSDHHILLLQGLEHEDVLDFRDKIHLNERGQRRLAEILLPEIEKSLSVN